MASTLRAGICWHIKRIGWASLWQRLLIMCAVVASACSPDPASPDDLAPSPDAVITLSPLSGGDWDLQFAFSEPRAAVLFPKAQDDYRRQSWTALSDTIDLVRISDMDVLVLDPPAQAARFRIHPWTDVLPRDYTPALAFRDGGLAFHLRQFEILELDSLDAAKQLLPDLSNYTGDNLSFEMLFNTDQPILAEGVLSPGPRSFSFEQDPGYIYVGPGDVIETDRYGGVIDPDLPGWILDDFDERLDAVFAHMEARFGGKLLGRLTVLYNFDGTDEPGSSVGGSTLQGPTMTLVVGGDAFLNAPGEFVQARVAFTLAHEVAHLFQKRRGQYRIRAVWLHEGHASAVAHDYLGHESFNALRDDRLCKDGMTDGAALLEALAVMPYECGQAVWSLADRLLPDADIYAIWTTLFETHNQSELGLSAGGFIDVMQTLGAEGADFGHLKAALRGANDPEIMSLLFPSSPFPTKLEGL